MLCAKCEHPVTPQKPSWRRCFSCGTLCLPCWMQHDCHFSWAELVRPPQAEDAVIHIAVTSRQIPMLMACIDDIVGRESKHPWLVRDDLAEMREEIIRQVEDQLD